MTNDFERSLLPQQTISEMIVAIIDVDLLNVLSAGLLEVLGSHLLEVLNADSFGKI